MVHGSHMSVASCNLLAEFEACLQSVNGVMGTFRFNAMGSLIIIIYTIIILEIAFVYVCIYGMSYNCLLIVIICIKERKTFKNEQGIRDAAAKKELIQVEYG